MLTKDPLSVVFTYVPMIDLGKAARCSSTFCRLIEKTLSNRLGNVLGVE